MAPHTDVTPHTPAAAPPPPTTATAPRLSVVIVNYRQWRATAALARRLLRGDAARRGLVEVVVMDNHSPSHPLAARLRRWPGVSLRRWGRNRGFARAANEGCRLSRGDWLLLLNPDMTVDARFADAALALAERLAGTRPRAGIVGLGLRNGDGSPQGSCGPFPTLAGTLAGLLRPRAWRKYHAAGAAAGRVAWVTGCGLLARRACLADLGGFADDFFLYYEDVDLCRRAAARGWEVWHEPGLSAVHHRPLQGRAVPAVLRLVTRHALLTYALRHWPRWQLAVLAAVVRLEAGLRRLRAWWRGRPDQAAVFRELGGLARELGRGDAAAARRRLRRVVRRGVARRERPAVTHG
jgi:GT2 family glycosyltransferase